MISPLRTSLLALSFIIASGAQHDVEASSYAVDSKPNQTAEMRQREEQHNARIQARNRKHEAKDREFRELVLAALKKADKTGKGRDLKKSVR